ncbi:hypothetical protein [Pseudomonas sp.]|uniref:hypothetical protein n=1 Tax=Pseudomonas sp. TaxID=306 RepID=UPI002617B383|nr:hypothetical protein [Pseudomonas sp.]
MTSPINPYGFSPFGGYGSGFGVGPSDAEAQAGFKAIDAKKRADGLENALEKAEAEKTNGKKAVTDAIRL